MNLCKKILLRGMMSAILGGVSLAAYAVVAPPPRTFVASTGSDTNGCTRTAPCRTFNAAMAVVAAGGEVIVLDAAGYGPANVTKAVSIIASGGIYAGVTVPDTGNGITLNPANATDSVLLQGLTFTTPYGGSAKGIVRTADCRLNIVKCAFSGFFDAIDAEGSPMGIVFVKDCLIKDSENGSGIVLSSSSGTVQGVVEGCQFINLVDTGVFAYINAQIAVRDSSSYRCNYGFRTQSDPSGPAEMTLEHCYAAFNGTGAGALASLSNLNKPSILRVSNSTLIDNGSGFVELFGGEVDSRNNNTMEGNGSNNLFAHFYSQR